MATQKKGNKVSETLKAIQEAQNLDELLSLDMAGNAELYMARDTRLNELRKAEAETNKAELEKARARAAELERTKRTSRGGSTAPTRADRITAALAALPAPGNLTDTLNEYVAGASKYSGFAVALAIAVKGDVPTALALLRRVYYMDAEAVRPWQGQENSVGLACLDALQFTGNLTADEREASEVIRETFAAYVARETADKPVKTREKSDK